jgi:long-chain acyl-CoA synthetase
MPDSGSILAGEVPGDEQHVVLIHKGQPVSRGDFRRDIDRYANGLSGHLQPGDLLAIDLPNSPAILALILACFRTGVVPMPLSPGLKWPELERMLQKARPDAFVTRRALTEVQLHSPAMNLRKVWLMPDGKSPFPATAGPVHFKPVPDDPERLALALHTSGSSGLPKGVMLAYRSLRHILDYRLNHCELGPDSVAVVASCVSQTVGLYQSLALLASGGQIVLLESYATEAMAEAVNRYAPTHMIMVVDAWDKLLHHPTINAHSLRRLRFAAAGADKLTPLVQQRFTELTGRALRSSYGLTESSWAIINPATDPQQALALGQPSPGVEIRLLDDAGQPVKTGSVGQIHIRSPRNLLGYLHDEAATRAILNNGWLTTGDLAWQDNEGTFWFAGRSKDIIVLATGDLVAPAEVEAVLCTHPAVKACLVAAQASERGSLLPWAWVVPAVETTAVELQQYLRERLSDFKVPAGIEFVTTLPTGLSGKIQRPAALPAA